MNDKFCHIVGDREHLSLEHNVHQQFFYFDTGRTVDIPEINGDLPIGGYWHLIYN